MEKPDSVTIKTITSFSRGTEIFVFGLGDDQKIYFWSYEKSAWFLNGEKK